MDSIDPIALAAQIAAGITLAACAGLRAFLPPLALGAAARAGLVELPPELGWLASTPALVVLTTALLVELLGDKVPAVDHLLDAVGTVTRPAAGALVAVAPALASLPASHEGAGWARLLVWGAGLAAALLGAVVSLLVHLAKSHLRLGSTMTSGGLANPALSLGEDALGLIGVAMAILIPLVAILALAAGVTLIAVLAVRRRRAPAPGRPDWTSPRG